MNAILFRPRWCLRYSQIERIRNRVKPIYSNSHLSPSSIRTTNPAHQGISVITKKVDQEEKQDFCIVNLYHLVDIPDPYHVVDLHRGWMMGHDIRGRIYFSEQGVNAQFTGPVLETEQYLHWMKRQPWFQDLKWNTDVVQEHMFPKLRLRVKPNLVQLNGGVSELPITQPTARATPLDPSKWRQQISEALETDGDDKKKSVILDVRNGYEWDAGHFEGALRPKEDSFAETPVLEDIPEALKDADKSTPVYMYCTGGIRCDIYSTVLRKQGFQNLYSLEGGVQRYFKEQGGRFWNGSLFVFDGRMAISPQGFDGSQKELPSSIRCQICGAEAQVPHVNCANVDCNRLFIACTNCKTRLRGCCCEQCIEAPRILRPMKSEGGFYGKFGTYTMERLKKSMVEGEIRHGARRQRRLERARKKREVVNKARIEMKRKICEETRRRTEQREDSSSNSLRDALQEMSLT